eukprot:gnl/TRDRNA2_/TRDRNA2_129256_c0_seq1.p1 gnl/TRDRNA2_/TRDRNA2_129256_c0~~gnl/TRDRNA2_/TRDRNA2_129256_c0_seq1.p1  ORF type:complete len:356 (-),score=28.09 gnl/TRDRNA2_/TRDRNA2_129256_c0_seq1:70-1137(-)
MRRCARCICCSCAVLWVYISVCIQGFLQVMREQHLDGSYFFFHPDWLPEALQALPKRPLDAEALAAFREDGVTVVRGVVPDQKILDHFAANSSHHTPFWFLNGHQMSLIRDGPLGILAASAMNESAVRAFASTPFVNAGGAPPGESILPSFPDGGPHADIFEIDMAVPLVTVWLAITDAPHAIEFVAGSYKSNFRHRCKPQSKESDWDCVRKLESEGRGRLWWDLKAGDALVFHSQTFHWTVWQSEPRHGVSARFVPADLAYSGWLTQEYTVQMVASYLPWECAPMSDSIIFPVAWDMARPQGPNTTEGTTASTWTWPVNPLRTDLMLWERRVSLCDTPMFDLFRRCRGRRISAA